MKKILLIVITIIVVGLLIWLQLGREASKPTIVETFTQTKGPVNYSIDVPLDWFPYESESSVIFTQDPNLEIPPNTEGFAIGPNFYVILHNFTDISGITTYEEWLDINGMTEKSPLFIESKTVNRNGYPMRRVITEAAGSEGEVLHYVYFVDVQRILTLNQYPYDPTSNITQVFETAVQTFRVPERQGGDGILPFKSGVSGVVTLGPTCPAMKNPPDPDCADNPYKTTVQVIATGSPKSSPFAVVESNDEGWYKVILPPGEYGIQPVGGDPQPRCETKNIVIEPDKMFRINLSCDTGIR